MTITQDNSGGTAVFHLEGRLDTTTSAQLDARLTEFFSQGDYNLELDFEKLTYISSTGLRVLLVAQKKVNAAGGGMVIRKASRPIKEIFDVTGFSGILTIE